jgi:hypothetical protein
VVRSSGIFSPQKENTRLFLRSEFENDYICLATPRAGIGSRGEAQTLGFYRPRSPEGTLAAARLRYARFIQQFTSTG